MLDPKRLATVAAVQLVPGPTGHSLARDRQVPTPQVHTPCRKQYV